MVPQDALPPVAGCGSANSRSYLTDALFASIDRCARVSCAANVPVNMPVTCVIGCDGAGFLPKLIPGCVKYCCASAKAVTWILITASGCSASVTDRRRGSLLTMTDRKSTRLNSSHLGISYAV